MTSKATVKLGLIGLSDPATVEKGRNHVKMLTGNPKYPGIISVLPKITKACDDLEESIQQVIMQGGKQAHQLKRTRLKVLQGLIKELAGLVQAESGGDIDMILAAGFTGRNPGQPVEKLEMPQNLRALLTDFIGQVPLRWNRVEDATNYQVFANKTNPDDEKAWELVAFTSKTRYNVEALESVKFYWFRVQAIGRKGLLSPMSKIVKALAA